ncbi:hypothetical protein D3C73_1460550 [compost metagenome]
MQGRRPPVKQDGIAFLNHFDRLGGNPHLLIKEPVLLIRKSGLKTDALQRNGSTVRPLKQLRFLQLLQIPAHR